MATVLYLVLDRETGEVSFSAAGHPPPLADRSAGRTTSRAGAPCRSAPPTRLSSASPRRSSSPAPRSSSTPTGSRSGATPLEERLDQLAAVAHAGTDLNGLCEDVLTAVLGDADPRRRRAARGPALPAVDTHISLTLPAEPGSLAQLRRRLARFLHATGATEVEQYEITPTICEAAGNAIEQPTAWATRPTRSRWSSTRRRAHRQRARHRQLAREARRAPRARAWASSRTSWTR